MERAVSSIVKAVNDYKSVSSGNKVYNALIWDLEAEWVKNPPMPVSVKHEIQCLQEDRQELIDKWQKPIQ